jgi:hypothetical protein
MNLLLIEKFKAHPDLVSADTEQHYIVNGVHWQGYEALLADLENDSPHLRLHYLEVHQS